jgi:cytidine deaminase
MDDPHIDALVDAARGARLHAYAPYSDFAVGAAVLAGGRIFTGVNVENASYPLSMCAERNAVGAMVTAGETVLEALAIVADAASPPSPCGGCRQVIWELGPSALVIAESLAGERLAWAIEDLLPAPFELQRP